MKRLLILITFILGFFSIVSSTNSIFNDPALKAVYQYKFSPAMMKDKKVKVRILIPFNFVIRK
jgi:outer membrane biosynthesis protein TonB